MKKAAVTDNGEKKGKKIQTQKLVKWGLIAVVVLGAVCGGYYLNTRPITVETITIEPKEAYSYITEKATVTEPEYTYVYPLLSGKLLQTFVQEGDAVRKGDKIAEIDGTGLQFMLEKMNNNITSYTVQKNGLYEQERKEKDALRTSKTSLQTQLDTLQASKNDAKTQETNAQTTKETQLEVTRLLVAQAEKSYTLAKTHYENTTALFGSGLIAKAELDKSKLEMDAAESLYSQNVAQLQLIEETKTVSQDAFYEASKRSIEEQIAGINNQLTKSYQAEMAQYYDTLIAGERISIEEASKSLNDRFVLSTVDGTIDTLYTNANVLSTSAYIAKIKPAKDLEIEAYISTLDIDSIKENDIVTLTYNRRDEDVTTKGKIVSIDDKAETVLSTLGVDEKKIKIKIEPEDSSFLKEGYTYDVEVPIYKESDKILVPKEALFKVADDYYVFVVEDGKAVERKVKKGIDTRTDSVIAEGLTVGETVIANADIETLKAGTKVKA